MSGLNRHIFFFTFIFALSASLLFAQNSDKDKEKTASQKRRYTRLSAPPKKQNNPVGKPFGYLNLSIYPGYRKILLDKEISFNISKNLLIPSGRHHLNIIAPKHFADTSIVLKMESGQIINQEVYLKDLATKKLFVPENTKKSSSSISWKTITQAGFFVLGISTTYFAFYQEQLASRSQERYDNMVGVHESFYAEQHDNTVDHVRWRNGFGGVAALAFTVGLTLWIF